MSIESMLVFVVALVVVTGSPGPSIAALVARVMTGGMSSVLPFLAAMWIGEALWFTAAILGLNALAQNFQLGFMILRYAGVAYLLYLAWQMWNRPRVEAADVPRLPNGSKLNMFLSGMAITIGNPKIMVFYLALLPGIIDLNVVGLEEWTQLTIVLLVICATVDLAWATAAEYARRMLNTSHARRIIDRCCAGMMAGAAAVIASRQ